MSDEEEQRIRYIKRPTVCLHRLSIEIQNTSEELQRLQGTTTGQHNPREDDGTRALAHNQQQQQQQPQGRRPRQQQRIRELQVRDRVLITNSYRGARSVTGTIVRVTPATVLIDPDSGGPEIRRYNANVAHLDQA